MKIQKEVKEITLAVLKGYKELHYKACFEDITGRPEYNCVCPLKDVISKIENAEEIN